jgi:ribulose-phosphate 3-epimerase
MTLIAPSILSADFANLAAEIKKVESAGADWLHVDVMDGGFVPNITIGAPVVQAIKPITNLFIDVHLMIFHPEKHIPDFIKAGADLISFHMEAYRLDDHDPKYLTHELAQKGHWWGEERQEAWEARGTNAKHYDITAIKNTIKLIKVQGAQAGISINPATPVSALQEVLSDISLVLLMSVNPGFGGQKFKPVVLDKIKELKAMTAKQNLNIDIEVDGGVTPGEIADSLKAAGANVLVAGSAIYRSSNIPETISELKKTCQANTY